MSDRPLAPHERGMSPMPRQTIWQALAHARERYGADHVAFRYPDEDRSLTLAEWEAGARAIAKGLLAREIRPGDTVAIWAPGRSIWPLALVAVAAIGARACGLNTRYRSSELEHVLDATRPRAVFCATDFLGIDSVGLVTDAARAVGLADLAEGTGLVECPRAAPDVASVGVTGLGRLEADGHDIPDAELDQRIAEVSPDDGALIQFTSGSTGNPKGVLISQDAGLRTGYYAAECQRLRPDDVMFSALPFYHIGGSLCTALSAMTTGATMVVPEKFDGPVALETIERERCTGFQGHGTLWKMLLQAQSEHPRGISALRKGWASGDRAMLEEVRTTLGVTDLVVVYGSSEGGTIAGSVPEDPLDGRIGTLGKPVPEAVVSIRDTESGEPVGTGTTGEIWVAGPSTMAGYLAGTAERVGPGAGWVRTGDLAIRDEDGFLHFQGRVDDRLKPGGENVSVIEIEQFISADPRIAQVAVVGVPDERLGDVPAAVIEVRAGEEVDPTEIVDWCRSSMATFKVPRYVRIVDRIPTLDMGKVDRRRVRAELLEHLESSGSLP